MESRGCINNLECVCVCVCMFPKDQKSKKTLLKENPKANLWVTVPIWVFTDCVPLDNLTGNTCCFLCRAVGKRRCAAGA